MYICIYLYPIGSLHQCAYQVVSIRPLSALPFSLHPFEHDTVPTSLRSLSLSSPPLLIFASAHTWSVAFSCLPMFLYPWEKLAQMFNSDLRNGKTYLRVK